MGDCRTWDSDSSIKRRTSELCLILSFDDGKEVRLRFFKRVATWIVEEAKRDGYGFPSLLSRVGFLIILATPIVSS